MIIETAKADEKTFKELSEFLLKGQFTEGAYAPLNPDKAAKAVYSALADGGTFIARDDEGKLIGTLPMTTYEYWYSDWIFLSNQWFYVDRQARFRDVGVKLMRAARLYAARKQQVDGSVGVTAFVMVNNPDRRAKGTATSLFAQIAGYTPLGHVLKLR